MPRAYVENRLWGHTYNPKDGGEKDKRTSGDLQPASLARVGEAPGLQRDSVSESQGRQ